MKSEFETSEYCIIPGRPGSRLHLQPRLGLTVRGV